MNSTLDCTVHEGRRRGGCRLRHPRRREDTGDKRHPSQPGRLTIAWGNVGRGTAAHMALLALCAESNVDVINVQEPATYVSSRSQSHPAYERFGPYEVWDAEDERPRVMSYVRKAAGLHAEPRCPVESRDLLWLDVNGYHILNFYRAPGSPEVLSYLCSLAPEGNTVAGGDANAVDSLWEPGGTPRAGGPALADWATSTGMIFTGEPGIPTHNMGHTLDLVFSNVPFAETSVRDDLLSGSDHRTLVTTLPSRGWAPEVQYHYKVTDDSLPDFAKAMEMGMAVLDDPAPLDTPQAFDEWIEEFNGIFAAALAFAGHLDQPRLGKAQWWTPDCKRAHKRLREAYRRLGLGPATHADCPEKRQFLTEVRLAKKQYWRERIDAAESDEEIFKVTAWCKPKATFRSPPIRIDGRVIDGSAEKARALTGALVRRFDATDDLPVDPLADLDSTEEKPALACDYPITLEEVDKNTVGHASTSPGVDRTTVRLMKAAWTSMRAKVHSLFNRLLEMGYYPRPWRLAEVVVIPKPGKKDMSSPRSYRPIALISCLGKGLERLLAKRMAWCTLKSGLVSPQQAGALPGRSATDLVASFVHDVEEALAQGKVASLALMDVQGAYDALLPRRLLLRLRRQGWPRRILLMVASFLSERRVRTRFEGTVTDPEPVHCGTPQGSPWSGLLYLLYLAELLSLDKRLSFGYADDLALVCIAKTLEESAAGLQRAIDRARAWGHTNKVIFAAEKYEIQHFSRKAGDKAKNPVVTLEDGTAITPPPLPGQVERGTRAKWKDLPAIRWLGVFLDRQLNFKRHVAERCAAASRVAGHLRGLSGVKFGPPADSLRKVVIACVLPSATYGAEVWYWGRTKPPANQTGPDVNSRDMGLVEKIQRCLDMGARAILPAYRTTPLPALGRDAGLPTARYALDKIRAGFAVRLLKVPEGHPLAGRSLPRRVYTQRQLGAPGRPRTRLSHAAAMIQAPFPRLNNSGPRFTPGAGSDPTGGVPKDKAAQAFKAWLVTLAAGSLIVYSDGSKSEHGVGYGFAIYRPMGTEPLLTGQGSLHADSTVFDAEALGAWRGTKAAARLEEGAKIYTCLDNSAVVRGLMGSAPESSQWAFNAYHKLAEARDIQAVWVPGHEGIRGNELADKLANEGAKHGPPDGESRPTLAGVTAQIKASLLRDFEKEWEITRAGLSDQYRRWELPRGLKCPAELKILPRNTLRHLLAARTGHGDFAWYHRRFHHDDAVLQCRCGKDKTTLHPIGCKYSRSSFARWPWPSPRPRLPPTTGRDRAAYMADLLESPALFSGFARVTGCYGSVGDVRGTKRG